MKHLHVKLVSVLLVLTIVFNLVACSSKKDNTNSSESEINIQLIGDINSDGPYASDDLKEITIKDLNINEINVVSVDPKDITVKSINIEEIQSIEVQVVPLNDQMVTLAYENFKSVYGEDIDVGKLIANLAVGTVCVVVMVALSYVSGPVGTFFGAVITSELSAVAVVLGAAIDAAISGYQAYQEGGDLSYILGHMINGVAEGLMWSAVLAPLTGAFSGIKAIRAVSNIKKMPAFANLSDREITKILKNLSKILKETKDLADDATDKVIKELFDQLPKELQDEINKDIFVSIVKSKDTLISIALKENPLGIRSEVLEALRENFWRNLDSVSDDAVKDIIKKIQKGTIKNIDDITDSEIREYIQRNACEFLDCYSDKLSDEFIENWIKKDIGENAFNSIKSNIKTSNGLIKISKDLGRDTLSEIMGSAEQYKLLVKRFGSECVDKLRSVDSIYRVIKGQSTVGDDIIYDAIEKMFEGSFNLSAANSSVVNNLTKHPESVSQILKNLGLGGKNKELLKELAINSLSGIEGVSDDVARGIVSTGMRKSSIISQYGDDVWKRITSNGYTSIASLNISADVDTTLVKEILHDSLSSQKISEELIELILRGEPYVTWGMSDKTLVEVGNVISEYYRATDKNLYKNFIFVYAESRGRNIEDIVELYKTNNSIRNIQYAGGVMVPAGENADYILAKYGEIKMSSYGFPIFDEFAIARVVLDNLTGDDAIDIANANLLHHGTKQSIPGYTWHHIEDGKTLILIPTELHDAYKHTGGAALLREGLL